MTGQVLVIGYGNPLRGDDGLGRVAADHLAGTVPPEGVRVLTAHQLTPEMAEPVSQARLALFIDVRVDEPAGTVRVEPVEPAPQGSQAISHGFEPAALLGLALDLYGSAPPAFTLTAGGEDFEIGEQLSPPVQAAVPVLVERALALIGDGSRH